MKQLEVDLSEQVEELEQSEDSTNYDFGIQSRFKLTLHRARPVTDFIWENITLTHRVARRCRTFLFWLIVIVMLGGFFMFNCYASYQVALVRYTQTPIGVDCTNFYRQEDSLLEQKAFLEYREQNGGAVSLRITHTTEDDINAKSSRAGYWVCFCKDEIYNNLEDPNKNYTLEHWTINEAEKTYQKETLEEPICALYKKNIEGRQYYLMQSHSINIVFLATLLRILITKIASFRYP